MRERHRRERVSEEEKPQAIAIAQYTRSVASGIRRPHVKNGKQAQLWKNWNPPRQR